MSEATKIDADLLSYATVRQLEILQAIDAAGSLRAAAVALDVNYSTVHGAWTAVKAKAALANRGGAEFAMNGLLSPVESLKGRSIYVGKDGEVAGQWLKSRVDDDKREACIRATIDALMTEAPRVRATPAPAGSLEADLCSVYTFTDSHVGMYAWAKETGEPWNLQIAEDVLCGVMDRMVLASPAADTAVVVNLGDFVHFDSLIPQTPTSGHPVDASGRYGEIVDVAIKVLRYLIMRALEKHRSVVVVCAEGNHDIVGSMWLRKILRLLFENEPRVRVVDSESPYYVHTHGKTMLCWHHGHLKKKDMLPLTFAARYPVEWGATRYRYIHTGHMHHVDEKEHPGIYVIQHPTLAANDAHSARHGYVSSRKATAITYHSTFGEVARTTVTPAMLALDA